MSTIKKGFTLIELLVVIGIITLLASLLLPALFKAKNSVKRINCVNNLHQIGLALRFYLDDYKKYPLVGDSNLRPRNIDRNHFWDAKLLAYCNGNKKIFICPANNVVVNDWNTNSNDNWFYTDSTGLLCPNRSYGYNGLGSALLAEYWGLTFGLSIQERQSQINESQVLYPSDMIAIGDMNLPSTDDDADGDFHCDMLFLGLAGYHTHRADVLFCDNHIEFAKTNIMTSTNYTIVQKWNYDHEYHVYP